MKDESKPGPVIGDLLRNLKEATVALAVEPQARASSLTDLADARLRVFEAEGAIAAFVAAEVAEARASRDLPPPEPVPMLLWCPECGERHVDVGRFETHAHHTHACQWCGMVWRPAVVPTVGVKFLPGYENAEAPVKRTR